MPDVTSPKMTYDPSKCGAGAMTMLKCPVLVFAPVFATDRSPGACFKRKPAGWVVERASWIDRTSSSGVRTRLIYESI